MNIIGDSPKFQKVVRTAELVATTDVPVLLMGEVGTGRDFFARRIHAVSRYSKHPFVKIHCMTLADETAVDELSSLRHGVLYLDEIADLSAPWQSTLLHFIETGQISLPDDSAASMGAKKVDLRLIASTTKDLKSRVDKGLFRADLYYRLNVIPIELPPLKQRDGDVPLLIDAFFREFVKQKRIIAPTISKAGMKRIIQYEWPGNVRELRNFCERMFILFSGREIDVANLPVEIRSFIKPGKTDLSPFSLPSSGINLESVEVDLMLQALDKSSGNKSRAARLLGLTRDTFLYRLKKYSIEA